MEGIRQVKTEISAETGTQFPEEVAALCKKADAFADEIKAKEAQIEKLKASG
jgi:hypothetical protein